MIVNTISRFFYFAKSHIKNATIPITSARNGKKNSDKKNTTTNATILPELMINSSFQFDLLKMDASSLRCLLLGNTIVPGVYIL